MRPDAYIDLLRSQFRSCSRFGPTGGAKQLMRIFHDLDAKLLTVGGEVIKNIEDFIMDDGSIILPLRLDTTDLNTVPTIGPLSDFASISFLKRSNTLIISQSTSETLVDNACHRHLAFTRRVCSHLNPKRVSIDVRINYLRGETESTDPCQLEYIHWGNLFGPECVKRHGRDFLLGAPGWRVEELGDGGILFAATESYLSWWENDQPEILSYFRKKAPKVRLYRRRTAPDKTG